MYYKIAGIVLYSQIRLLSFQRFICEPTTYDISLTLSDEPVPDGAEVRSDDIVQRKIDDGWYYHHVRDDGVGLLVSDDYSILRLVGHEKEVTEVRHATFLEEAFVRMALECLLARRGCVSLHSACVELDSEAYAFSGPSGTGKSTRAEAWGEALGAKLISGDRPLIDINRLEAYGVPWDGKELCYRNVHYPLRAIFEVRRKESIRESADGPYIRKMTFDQKRKLLMRQCFIPMWDTETALIQMMNITKLASSDMIVRAFCGQYPEDAAALRNAFIKGDYKKEEIDMKVKEGFVLRNIVNEKILMPTGENIGKFKGTVLLNDVSAFVWEKLQNPMSRDDLLAAIMDEYEVEESIAAADLDNLLARFDEYGVIEKD